MQVGVNAPGWSDGNANCTIPPGFNFRQCLVPLGVFAPPGPSNPNPAPTGSDYGVCMFGSIQGAFNGFDTDWGTFVGIGVQVIPPNPYGQWVAAADGIDPDWILATVQCIHQSEITGFAGFDSTQYFSFDTWSNNSNPDSQSVGASPQDLAPLTGYGSAHALGAAGRPFSESQPQGPITVLTAARQNTTAGPQSGQYLQTAQTWDTHGISPINLMQPLVVSGYGGPTYVQLAPAQNAFCYLAGIGDLEGNAYPEADMAQVVSVPTQNGNQWILTKSRAGMYASATCIAIQ